MEDLLVKKNRKRIIQISMVLVSISALSSCGHKHVYNSQYFYNDFVHCRTCSCGKCSDVSPHEYGDLYVSDPFGQKLLHKCSECFYVEEYTSQTNYSLDLVERGQIYFSDFNELKKKLNDTGYSPKNSSIYFIEKENLTTSFQMRSNSYDRCITYVKVKNDSIYAINLFDAYEFYDPSLDIDPANSNGKANIRVHFHFAQFDDQWPIFPLYYGMNKIAGKTYFYYKMVTHNLGQIIGEVGVNFNEEYCKADVIYCSKYLERNLRILDLLSLDKSFA